MDHCEEHSGCIARIDGIEETIKRLDIVIEKMRNRPPVWATFALSCSGLLLGSALTFIGVLIKGV